MKFTNVFSLGVVIATAFTVTTAAPISSSIAAREAHYAAIARSFEELDARDPFNIGGFFKAVAPFAKPFVAKIPKVGGFLSKFFRRDGSLDEELLNDFLVAQALADQNKVAARSLELEDLVARDPFDFGGLFKAVAPFAKPFVQKIPKVGGFLSKFFRRDGTIDEELLNDFIAAQALASRSNVAARSLEIDDLVARDPFNFGGFIKAVAPFAKPFVAKIPKVGGFLSKFFRRDGSLDEELLNDFLVSQALAAENRVAARSTEDTVNDLVASALLSELGSSIAARTVIFPNPQVKDIIPVVKDVVQAIGNFFGGLFRRGDDLNDDDVAGLIAELVTDLSRRDTRDAANAWNDFVTAIVDAQ
jgi:hypothetical protein